MPILSHVLLEAKKDNLVVSRSDPGRPSGGYQHGLSMTAFVLGPAPLPPS
jgi:hypothetical protein